ncbi:23S rRNA (uracil(1939)-C(5))-methyltransferase RlmD [Bisbaumannia pacifica]|uniref:23S rRNA (uracil(1939)-C(5))-methyltransferase RlmD n=1 Tax=Bisbaumannia pacifica TaxID=77098 RepID=A0A510X5T3_9GAMM|nr:methyltransferase domain-containing protein [Halomonas pacifica]GEK46773.1 23S rRNA (uracil(1939)-C(5))-methyltransferase RlmD [Halomonas pacifica]
MAMLGKRRPPRRRSGVSGLSGRAATPAPAPVGDEGGVVIERLAHDGRGLTHGADGKACFVEGALPGERVRLAVHRQRKRFDEAHLRELITASPERIEPPCAHYGSCGGCDLQHLTPHAQRRHKQAVLAEQLGRQGVALEAPLQLLAGEGLGYRRRARLGVRLDAEGTLHLGFRGRRSHHLVDIAACPVLTPSLDRLLPALREHLPSLEAPRQVGHLELIDSDAGVALVVRQLRDNPRDAERWRAFAERQGVHLAWLLGREAPVLRWLGEAPSLHYALGELRVHFAPGDFIQVNGEVNRALVEHALAWLAPAPGEAVLDLFAGVGNFSLPLAAAGARVTGVEGSPAMVERLADNARANALSLAARQADLNDPGAVARLLDEVPATAALLDPPREGAEAVCRALAKQGAVERLLYVSCDPATLARDAAILAAGGLRPVRGAVADMFAQTAHLESVLLFRRGEG